MRITNQMTTNRMLLNINRNANAVNNFYTQLASGKKIQLGSENPIIASRALKFRTNVSETTQYLSNVAQGMSWMEITEAAMSNIAESISLIKERSTEGSTGTKALADKHTFSNQLESYLAQLRDEMNVTYAGRYIFSGYRTDTPPIFTKANNESYTITQYFSATDIEHVKTYIKTDSSALPEASEVDRLKLPYTNLDSNSLTQLDVLDKAGNVVDTIIVEELDSANSNTGNGDSAYKPDTMRAYYIKDTGEIILGKDALDVINANADGSIKAVYSKTNFASGELNPLVYFDCVDNNTGKAYTMDDQNLQFEFGINTRVTVNNLAKDNLTASLYSDMKALIQMVNNISYTTESELKAKYENLGYTGDDLQEQITKQLSDEKQIYEGVLQNAFSNMLGLIEKHATQASKEYTQLGSRMNRLELISNRLTEDKLSYTTLMSENENVDVVEATMNLNTANYVYQMALQVGGNIMQISLADFIR